MRTIEEEIKNRLPCTDFEYDLINLCYERDQIIEELEKQIERLLARLEVTNDIENEINRIYCRGRW